MEFSSIRTINASLDAVWTTQIAHSSWPERVPNFTKVVAQSAEPAVGSVVTITQPQLGAVDWTVTRFHATGDVRGFAWTGRAKGATYEGRHDVAVAPGGGATLTLGLTANGFVMAILGPLLRKRLQRTIDAEADAFERWALAIDKP